MNGIHTSVRNIIAALVLIALSASPSLAQAIQGHPQKQFYASQSEWPLVSAQGHWRHDAASMMSHTHVECWAPVYARTTAGTITLPCRLQLFHVAGSVTELRGEMLQGIVWETTGTADRPSLVGDPMGLRIINFTATFDTSPRPGNPWDEPAQTRNVPLHGWWQARIGAVTRFDTGDATVTYLGMPFFSVQDTTQPILWQFSAPTLSAVVDSSSAVTGGLFGTHLSMYDGTFPPILVPITEPVAVLSHNIAYIAALDRLPLGTFRQVLDPDLHNGVPGTLIGSSQSSGGNNHGDAVLFDTTRMSVGNHKVAIMWEQTTHPDSAIEPGQLVASLLVVNVAVGAGTTPPPPPPPVEACGDNIDNDGDGQIDEGCVVAPPPPPVETWAPVTGGFEKSSTTGAIRLVIGGVVVATWN